MTLRLTSMQEPRQTATKQLTPILLLSGNLNIEKIIASDEPVSLLYLNLDMVFESIGQLQLQQNY